jgi:DnaK suppressor protein
VTKTTAPAKKATSSAAAKSATAKGATAKSAPAKAVTPAAPDTESPPKPTSAATKAPTLKTSSTQTMPAATATKADAKLANAWKTKSGRELTEAELLAMPDSEYMSDKQLDFFRANLEAQKEDLLSNAGETTEHLREDTSIVPDPADRATIEEEHALELRTRDRERKLLKKISQALVRIDSGEYGFCDETGEPIGLGRLLARPTATLSLEAQQRRELKQKMFGD